MHACAHAWARVLASGQRLPPALLDAAAFGQRPPSARSDNALNPCCVHRPPFPVSMLSIISEPPPPRGALTPLATHSNFSRCIPPVPHIKEQHTRHPSESAPPSAPHLPSIRPTICPTPAIHPPHHLPHTRHPSAPKKQLACVRRRTSPAVLSASSRARAWPSSRSFWFASRSRPRAIGSLYTLRNVVGHPSRVELVEVVLHRRAGQQHAAGAVQRQERVDGLATARALDCGATAGWAATAALRTRRATHKRAEYTRWQPDLAFATNHDTACLSWLVITTERNRPLEIQSSREAGRHGMARVGGGCAAVEHVEESDIRPGRAGKCNRHETRGRQAGIKGMTNRSKQVELLEGDGMGVAAGTRSQ
eukprot:364072-Chlamydomonas_euryale.AAC.2